MPDHTSPRLSEIRARAHVNCLGGCTAPSSCRCASRCADMCRGPGGGMCFEVICDVAGEFSFVNHGVGHGRRGASASSSSSREPKRGRWSTDVPNDPSRFLGLSSYAARSRFSQPKKLGHRADRPGPQRDFTGELRRRHPRGPRGSQGPSRVSCPHHSCRHARRRKTRRSPA